MNKRTKNTGITLISLVITIIIMLILVGVSITLAVNGGLFEYAGNAVGDTKNAINKDGELGTGSIIEKYLYNISDEVAKLPTYSEELLDETTKVLTTNAKYISDNQVAVIPKGFKIIPGLNNTTTIADGLVIQDAEGNEFVWIPVTEELENSYTNSSYSEPKELTSTFIGSGAAYDHQTTLTILYGNKFNYDNDFNYTKEYEKMVAQVNKYGGFYIGRYETTIDESDNIGSKYNEKVLTASDQFTHNNTSYNYRWYGLYYFQKNANVTGNKEDVQTAMIYGQLWDKAMEFIRTNDTNYNVDSYTSEWHSGSSVVNSGQANPGDIALNIWDLESNALEWTQEAKSTDYRVRRGGLFNGRGCASGRDFDGDIPVWSDGGYLSSRLVLYIN